VSLSTAKNTTKTVPPPLFSATVAQRKQLQIIQRTNLDLITPKSRLRNRAGLLAKDPGGFSDPSFPACYRLIPCYRPRSCDDDFAFFRLRYASVRQAALFLGLI
jgi:hypothetical protein